MAVYGVNPSLFPNHHPQPQYAGYPQPTATPRYGVYGYGGTRRQATQPTYLNPPNVNDPTLAAGTAGSYSGGGESVPNGAVPWSSFGTGNVNMMFQQGYRKKMINGQWYLVPPTGAAEPAAYHIF